MEPRGGIRSPVLSPLRGTDAPRCVGRHDLGHGPPARARALALWPLVPEWSLRPCPAPRGETPSSTYSTVRRRPWSKRTAGTYLSARTKAMRSKSRRAPAFSTPWDSPPSAASIRSSGATTPSHSTPRSRPVCFSETGRDSPTSSRATSADGSRLTPTRRSTTSRAPTPTGAGPKRYRRVLLGLGTAHPGATEALDPILGLLPRHEDQGRWNRVPPIRSSPDLGRGCPPYLAPVGRVAHPAQRLLDDEPCRLPGDRETDHVRAGRHKQWHLVV